MADKGNVKGAQAEEAMRAVFRQMGYFVVRGIPYAFRDFSVTDVDLWLYGRAAGFRERINVDIKNKRTPQAIERVLWTLGAMRVLRMDKCIVVTTETNPAVAEFGRRNGVSVVDGRFLHEAMSRPVAGRLSEEAFIAAICPSGAEEKAKELKARYEGAKRRLLTHFNYDGSNVHVLGIRACMEDMIAYPGLASSVRRVFYVLLSYLLLTVDYLVNRSRFVKDEERQKELEAGLRYGDAGQVRLDEFIRLLGQCKGADARTNNVIDDVVGKLRTEAGDLRSDMIAEFLIRQITPEKLLDRAVAFEDAAFSDDCPSVSDLPLELRSFVFMLVDFNQLDRKAAASW